MPVELGALIGAAAYLLVQTTVIAYAWGRLRQKADNVENWMAAIDKRFEHLPCVDDPIYQRSMGELTASVNDHERRLCRHDKILNGAPGPGRRFYDTNPPE